MHVTDFLQPGCVALRQPAASLPDALHRLVGLMENSGVLADAAAFEADVCRRETLGSTCVGRGLAIPHAKSAAVRAPGLAALTLDPPLPAATPDGVPIAMMFLIAAPQDANDLHVRVLASLAALLLDKNLCAQLLQAESPGHFCRLIAGQELANRDAVSPGGPAAAGRRCRVLAVTACPTGLAHTYLAAEALQNAAAERHMAIRVETNGATGVENELTSEEIAAADCIIVAANRTVSTARFVGKRLLSVSAGEAVRDAGALLDKATGGQVPVYRGGNAVLTNDWRELGREAYRHLMYGISHMLPFVVAGGVLIALSLMLNNFGLSASFTGLLDNIGRSAFVLIYPVLAAFIAYSIGDMPAFMPGLMGGYLAQMGTTAGNEESWISSGFWGALIAGFAAGLLVRLLNRLGRRLPGGLENVKVSLLAPVISLLGVGLLMVLVVNPPLGRFNSWLYLVLAELRGGSRLFLGAVLGALMATDYGGPINKAAYLTGTLALVSDQTDIMAAVMIGGMVPPIGVALACLLFKSRFTPEEQRTAPQNLLMGASFVTEGALPFALRDPLRVGPSCMAGSGLAGLLAVLFGCGCPAPHGGLFLLAVINNPLGFLAALAAGSLLTAVLLGVLKKPLPQRKR